MPNKGKLQSEQTKATQQQQRYRSIPSVHELVESAELAKRAPHPHVVEVVRQVLADYRAELTSQTSAVAPLTMQQLAGRVVHVLERRQRPVLRPVINATGIILHTGLGRAPLAACAAAALAEVATQYANVEIDLETGERSKRIVIVHDLLCRLTGAESAAVVNNNAAATLLVLATVADIHASQAQNVVVSRGELIEIGGSFRLPEIMKTSGAALRESGTTNKTHLHDYEQAIDERTAALMKVHPSNYRVQGFTKEVSIEELVKLGHARGLAVIHDIGSGAMFDFAEYGLHDEPLAAESIKAGADLVLFSGDKLLGGPQAGIIVGKREWVAKASNNPLMRALRVGKLTLAALEATLRLHLDRDRCSRELPILTMAAADASALAQRAETVAHALREIDTLVRVDVQTTTAYLGGGAMPTQGIDSAAVRMCHQSLSEENLARRLRNGQPAVMPRLHDAAVWLDMRTVLPEQDDALVQAVRAACT